MKRYSGRTVNDLPMEKINDPDRGYLDRCAAGIFVKTTGELLKKKDTVTWGLPGGTSIRGILGMLAQNRELEWSRVHFFMADERLVPLDNPRSNFKIVMESLLAPLVQRSLITEENIHPFRYMESLDDAGTAVYEKELMSFGGRFDLLLLSSGEDGHIASIFPGHSSVMHDTEDYFLIIDDSPKPPALRMSASRRLLSRSGTCVLLFYGRSKKDAYERFSSSHTSLEDCPARIAYAIKDSHVLTDQGE